ncbi:shewanella-like protein phosphatase 2 [Hordeum vulgare subsp. vulgare]|uniref:Calcineurin-like phosphoesterase domain-containing protein n=1 Tax=Hordeum vulgare subsp. vulgare TaxID=112509 RepID=A0A8I6XFZ6_HORVV|nr:shewanella-like protein phosphatase 2 [Hordeum vulgare subsp. vulgare]
MAPASPDVPTCGGLPAVVSAFADAFVDHAVSGIFFPTNPPPPPPPTPATFLPSPSRLVAIGDLHGDLPKSLTALRLAGLLPSANSPGSSASATSTSWSAGPTLAVQLGDIMDRGGDELRLLYFLRRLSISAAAQGGALLPILGNHEVMNVSGDFRFVTPQGLQEFSGWAGWYRAGLAIKRRCGGLEQPKNPFLGVPKAFPGIRREFWDGIRSRLAALRPDGPIARRFLADLPTVLVVGDSVFVHGGLLEANVEYGLERINAEVSDWIRGERGDNARAPEYLCGRDAVVWLRRFSEGFNCDCQRLQGVLGMIPGAKRMVMGHTIQSEGINAVCGAQAVRVDVGLSRGCGNGLPEVLEINGGGSEVRVITTDPTEAWQYRKQKPEKSATTLEKKGEVKDGLALLVRESNVLKGVEAKA